MYLRFVRPEFIEGMRARAGFFCAAYEMLERPDVPQATLDQLSHHLAWFRENLSVPDRFNRTRSKGHYRRDTKGLSWFKADAAEPLGRAYALIAVLRENGYVTETLKSSRIGYIVYGDPWQAVAEPFSDTPQ